MRFRNAILAMIGKPNHTRILDRRPKQRMGLQSLHDHFGADPASSQNPAHRCPADLKTAGDFGFADPGAMQFPDFRRMYGRGCRPSQPFPVLPRMGQASPSPFPQNLSFKLSVLRRNAIR